MAKPALFATEADLVAAFCSTIDPAHWERNPAHAPLWTAYHETADWDLLLVHQITGEQIGIEAKLSLNAKVLEQSLPGRWASERGPDYRAVLVPMGAEQHHMASLAHHLGITVLRVAPTGLGGDHQWQCNPSLPDRIMGDHHWAHWLPAERCSVPDYIPDVTGGHAAPVKLSEWKIKAIKLLILLERRGHVTRRDMKLLGLSPSRWTDNWHGFLSANPVIGGYVRNDRTPDLKAQHPTNWAQIEADFGDWAKTLWTDGRLNLVEA